MNEQELAHRVVRHLEASLDAMPASAISRLRALREAAVARAQQSGLESVDDSGALRRQPGPWLRPRVLAPTFMLVLAALALWSFREQAPPPEEVAALDSELLTDDLPVVAYLDQGFEIWLYHHVSAER